MTYELASARFGWNFDVLKKVQAFHFKLGQGAKTGTGGHLPGSKVKGRIAEVRGLPDKTGSKEMDRYPSHEKDRGGSVAVVVHCEGGHVLVPNYSGAIAVDNEGKEIRKWSGADNHYEDFIGAVRSRKHTDLNADILEGHLSSALCHTGNVSYRLGQQAGPDEIRTPALWGLRFRMRAAEATR